MIREQRKHFDNFIINTRFNDTNIRARLGHSRLKVACFRLNMRWKQLDMRVPPSV